MRVEWLVLVGMSSALVLGGCRGEEACVLSADCSDGEVCQVARPGATGECVPEGEYELPPDHGGLSPWAGEVLLSTNRDVDVLFVIDNSGSMGAAQARLARAAGAFFDVLEREERRSSYRVAFTTTDDGNPWCMGTTPEAGVLQLSSCRGRLEQFTWLGTNPPTVVEDEACRDVCPLEPAQLDALMKPTATADDPSLRVRPWIEDDLGVGNLPDGVEAAQAFACFAPPGIDGCGFESHLKSMYKSLKRSFTAEDDAYGFVRTAAVLAVVIVTDEVDCSAADDWEEIFDANGTKTFWSDPDAATPTSALCWNAGVACTGDPGGYDACTPADKNVDGHPAAAEYEAVLNPLSRYVDLLQGLENGKKMLNPDQEIVVGVIAGVPSGYATGEAQIPYADAVDPSFQLEWGIGPGCTSNIDGVDQFGLPPVRLRDWAEEFDDRPIYSVCDGDYAPALEAVAETIAAQMHSSCYVDCVGDDDPDLGGLQPRCEVWQEVIGGDKRRMAECELEDGDWRLPDGVDACYAIRTDESMSGNAFDDMSQECADYGWNLEFEILRRPGTGHVDAVLASCLRSATPDTDCPNLGG